MRQVVKEFFTQVYGYDGYEVRMTVVVGPEMKRLLEHLAERIGADDYTIQETRELSGQVENLGRRRDDTHCTLNLPGRVGSEAQGGSQGGPGGSDPAGAGESEN